MADNARLDIRPSPPLLAHSGLLSQPLLTTETIEHIRSIVAEHGADAWWEMETADLLPPVMCLLSKPLEYFNSHFT